MSNSRIILLLSVLLLTACSKKVITTATAPKPDIAVQEIDFDYLQGKARVVLQDGVKEREVKANIRVRKDSVVWMAFSVIGVHGGKALINQDSITIVNNVEKQYYVFDYAELSKRFNFNINYKVIQAAMLGNLLMPRKPGDKIEQRDSLYILRQSSGTVSVVNYINGTTKKIVKVELKELDSNNTLTINYSNFQALGTKLFPYNGTLSLFYKSPTGLLNTTIIFEYNKTEIADKELKFPFNIPKRYDLR